MAKYLFNNVELPTPPGVFYKYVAIDFSEEYGYRLTYSQLPIEYDGATLNLNPSYAGYNFKYSIYKITDNAWILEGNFSTKVQVVGVITGELIWTNHDVLNSDGSVYFAASAPVVELTDFVIMSSTDYRAACDSIRAKTGRNILITSGRMSDEIDLIDITPPLQSKSVTGNGVVEPDSGYYGLSYVRVESKLPSVIARTVEDICEDEWGGETQIGAWAFAFCDKLTGIDIPTTVETIGMRAFYMCESLEQVYFAGTPDNIDATAFGGCGNLVEIYVPWSEGEVAGAPWGATNATIEYDW